MHIRAHVDHRTGVHSADVSTEGESRSLAIPGRPSGGSSVNGGELLFLALATCYCNDIYREAAGRGIEVWHVDVTVEGDFGRPGEPARNVRYRARVAADADDDTVEALMRHTDGVAEIQNTLREGVPVALAAAIVEQR